MSKIRKDDKVIVRTGKDRGKTGKVFRVFPKTDQVVVENVNVVKKAVKKNDQYPQGGFIETEKSIHVSNVMLLDKKDKPTRIGFKIEKDGSKVRIAKKTGEVI